MSELKQLLIQPQPQEKAGNMYVSQSVFLKHFTLTYKHLSLHFDNFIAFANWGSHFNIILSAKNL